MQLVLAIVHCYVCDGLLGQDVYFILRRQQHRSNHCKQKPYFRSEPWENIIKFVIN